MDIITLLLSNKELLGITATTAITLGGLFAFIFYLLKATKQDIVDLKTLFEQELTGLKKSLEIGTSIEILKHQKDCNECNLKSYATKDEVSSIKDSIESLAVEMRETRVDMTHSIKEIYNTLIKMSEK